MCWERRRIFIEKKKQGFWRNESTYALSPSQFRTRKSLRFLRFSLYTYILEIDPNDYIGVGKNVYVDDPARDATPRASGQDGSKCPFLLPCQCKQPSVRGSIGVQLIMLKVKGGDFFPLSFALYSSAPRLGVRCTI